MALASIIDPPTDQPSFYLWTQAHAVHHAACVSAASKKYTRQFDNYILDPFDPNDMEDWLNQHAQMHQEMDLQLKIAGGYDLTSLDWNDDFSVQNWFAYNYAEHAAWAKILNVG